MIAKKKGKQTKLKKKRWKYPSELETYSNSHPVFDKPGNDPTYSERLAYGFGLTDTRDDNDDDEPLLAFCNGLEIRR